MPVDEIPITGEDGLTYEVATKKDSDNIHHERDVLEFLDVDGEPIAVSATDPLPVSDAAVLAKLTDDPATETTLAAAKADLDQAVTDLNTLSGAVTGTKVRVSNVDPLPAGGNAIGSVAVNSGPAASRATDSVSAAPATDAVMNGLAALPPKFAPITVSASGATTVVAAVAGKKLRILGFYLVCAASVGVNWRSHTTTAHATGPAPCAANGGVVAPIDPLGWFETVAGEALDLNLTAAVAVGGTVTYIEV